MFSGCRPGDAKKGMWILLINSCLVLRAVVNQQLISSCNLVQSFFEVSMHGFAYLVSLLFPCNNKPGKSVAQCRQAGMGSKHRYIFVNLLCVRPLKTEPADGRRLRRHIRPPRETRPALGARPEREGLSPDDSSPLRRRDRHLWGTVSERGLDSKREHHDHNISGWQFNLLQICQGNLEK